MAAIERGEEREARRGAEELGRQQLHDQLHDLEVVGREVRWASFAADL